MKVYKANISNQPKTGGRKILGIFIIFIVIAGFLASAWFLFQILKPVSIEHQIFVVGQGEGVNQISQSLADQGTIKSKFVFESYVFLKGIEGDLKAGEYNLPKVLNIKRLAEILVAGAQPKEWELTVIEGWTIKDIAFKLEDLGKFQAEELIKATEDFDISGYDFLADKPKKTNLEGYLFPDTYRFFAYATIDDVIRKGDVNSKGGGHTIIEIDYGHIQTCGIPAECISEDQHHEEGHYQNKR